MNPETTIYEDPSSLRVEDWEVFCQQMREEAARYPDSQNVRLTLQSAERALREIRETWTVIEARAA